VSRLVLASRSPQRRAILARLGVPFEVRPSDAPELENGEPRALALENAFRKASAVAARVPGELVLGVDTLVSLGARLYGKPVDEADARTMLSALSGRRHTVVSGICLIADGSARTAAASTAVEFRSLDATLIDWYLSSGEWRERAGAYAIQGRGAALVAGIEGDFLNVVGLPVTTLLELAPGLLSA
jgi:septum formation protein